MVGKQFGSWRVVRVATSDEKSQQHRGTFYVCECACGKIGIVRNDQLKAGRSTKCESCRLNKWKLLVTKHNMHLTSTYNVWRGVQKRCTLPSHPSYKYYGARGITYCERWKKFEAFLEDMGTKPDIHYQIDRIDPRGNYEPGNCRWITASENTDRRNGKLL